MQCSVVQKQCHFTGAIDALKMLDKYIAPGCVLLFDDLVNYPNYRDHEILALWEWLQSTGRKLEVHWLTDLGIILFACLVIYRSKQMFVHVTNFHPSRLVLALVNACSCSRISFCAVASELREFVLQVVGVLGPLPDKTYSMEMEPPIDMGWFHQSVAFIVL